MHLFAYTLIGSGVTRGLCQGGTTSLKVPTGQRMEPANQHPEKIEKW